MLELSKCTVLVVDDTEANIDVLVEALGSEYEVSVAMDGMSALETVNDDPPDMILLDIMMPDMDGYEFCRRIKSNPKTGGIPIVFITSMSEIQNKTKGFELGAVDYITKPFDVLEVKARVKTHRFYVSHWKLRIPIMRSGIKLATHRDSMVTKFQYQEGL